MSISQEPNVSATDTLAVTEQVAPQISALTPEDTAVFLDVGQALANISTDTERNVQNCVTQLMPYVTTSKDDDGKETKSITYDVYMGFHAKVSAGFAIVKPWGDNADLYLSYLKSDISPFVGKVLDMLGVAIPNSPTKGATTKRSSRKQQSEKIEKLAKDNSLDELEAKANEQRALANKSPIRSEARSKANKKANEFELAYAKKESILAGALVELAKPFSKEVTENKKELTCVSRLVAMLCIANPAMVSKLHFVDTYSWVEKNKNYPVFQKEMEEWLKAMPSFAKHIMQTKDSPFEIKK